MATCKKCGASFEGDGDTCATCRTADQFSIKVESILKRGKDTTANYTEEDRKSNTLMGILCYLSILVLIPLFAAKDSKFVRFHANQGLILFVIEVICSALCSALTMLLAWIFVPLGILAGLISILVGLVAFIFIILGIVNVVNGHAKELPFIGGVSLLK